MIVQMYPLLFGPLFLAALLLILFDSQSGWLFYLFVYMMLAALVWLCWKGIRYRRVTEKIRQTIQPAPKHTAVKLVQCALGAAGAVCACLAAQQPNPERSPFLWLTFALFLALVAMVVVQRIRRPENRQIPALAWVQYGLLQADVLCLLLCLILRLRQWMGWGMLVLSGAGLILSILFCCKHPVRPKALYWEKFPIQPPVRQRLTWYGGFCLVVCLGALLLGLAILNYVPSPGLYQGMMTAFSVFCLLFLLLLFPILQQGVWQRLSWRWYSGTWRMPKQTGWEWAGFGFSLAAALLAVAAAVSLCFLPKTNSGVGWMLLVLAAVALGGFLTCLEGLHKNKKPSLPEPVSQPPLEP